MPTGVLAAPAVSRETAASPYRWLALAAATVALGGFARSYYLKGFFGTRSLGVTLQVHALVMSAWLGVFIVQTWLVAAHRVQWHRRLGVPAAALAVLVVGMGAWLTVQGVAGEAHAHRVGRFHYLLLINLVNLLLFGVFVGCGLALRARPEVHKRLMLLAGSRCRRQPWPGSCCCLRTDQCPSSSPSAPVSPDACLSIRCGTDVCIRCWAGAP
jgi:hypothetical protein